MKQLFEWQTDKGFAKVMSSETATFLIEVEKNCMSGDVYDLYYSDELGRDKKGIAFDLTEKECFDMLDKIGKGE